MTREEMAELFQEYDFEFNSFENRVTNKLSSRPDLHVFILLDSLDPGSRDAVAAAEHDEIFLDFDQDKVAAAITAEQVTELCYCGVRYRNDGMGFRMFV